MTGIDTAAWRGRLGRLAFPDVTEAVVVQCGTDWLRPELFAFRNEVDRTVLTAQLARGPALTIHRIVLQNLPVSRPSGIAPRAMDEAFDEWNHRLASSLALLRTHDRPVPRIHRLILQGDQAGAGVPDMVEIREAGRWSSPQRAAMAHRLFTGSGSGTSSTTPMTSYDVDLDGPFGDADPSVHM